MVRVEDVTEESKKLNSTLSLAKEIFNGVYSVFFEKNSCPPISINVMAKFRRRISSINPEGGFLILYDKDYLEKANSFAEQYEQRFNLKEDFVIKTDYSGLFSQR